MNSPAPTSLATENPETCASSARPAPSSPLALRLVRGAAFVVLAFILTALLALAVLSSTRLGDRFASGDPIVGGITLGCLVLLPFGLLALASRLRLRSWWWTGGGYLVVLPILTYLAIDDPLVLHATTMEEIAPAFSGAEKSYSVLMQYSKQQPSDEAKAFQNFKGRIIGMPVSPDKREDWTAFLKKNREAIEADWADLAPQRRWLAELNTFDRFGDLGEASFEANIITFQVWRLLSQRSVQMAGLRVLDGQPDEAIETMLPILNAGRKLQPSARSLVRFMVAIVVEKMTVLYALNITEHATISAATKAKLAAVLAGGVRGEAGARRLVGIENAYVMTSYHGKPIGDLLGNVQFGPDSKLKPGVRPLLNLISPFVYNSRRTVNLMGELNREMQDLAARRETISNERYAEVTRPRFKNFVGPILADKATPAYTKTVAAYWELHDTREKLSARLLPGN